MSAKLMFMPTAALCLFASVALAEQSVIQLPPETAVLKKSDQPGYALALQKCAICHSADYINLQPPHMKPAQWQSEVAKMQHAYGAPVSDEEARLIGEYLGKTYGTTE